MDRPKLDARFARRAESRRWSRRLRPCEKGARSAWRRPTDGICRCADHSLWSARGTPPTLAECHRGSENRSAPGPKPRHAFHWTAGPDRVGNARQRTQLKIGEKLLAPRV